MMVIKTIVYILVIYLYFNVDALTIGDNNVCVRMIQTTEYVVRNESYPCLKGRWMTKDQCGLRKLLNGKCFKMMEEKCWHQITYCITSWVEKPYCCKGYEDDGTGNCVASVMCGTNNGGCQHSCQTDGGSMKCVCWEGYTKNSTYTCADINECFVNRGGCEQYCHNTFGSFYCSCSSGYRLTSQNTCEEIDECQMGNGMCEHNCHNVGGGYYCSCNKGFYLSDGYMCEDVDECSDPMFNDGCELCINDFGGFHCSCPERKILDIDNKTCLSLVTDEMTTTKTTVKPTNEITADSTEVTFGPTEQPLVGSTAAQTSNMCPITPVSTIVGAVIGTIIVILVVVIVVILIIRYKEVLFNRNLSKRELPIISNANVTSEETKPVEDKGVYDNFQGNSSNKSSVFDDSIYEGEVPSGKEAEEDLYDYPGYATPNDVTRIAPNSSSDYTYAV